METTTPSKRKPLSRMLVARHLLRWRQMLAVVLFAGLASAAVMFIRAAGSVTSSEAETGTLVGAVQQISDATASGGKAVKFGGAVTGLTPKGLRAYTGGNSIALRWKAPDSPYVASKYMVYRDGTKVATIDVASAPVRVREVQGAEYYDEDIAPGQSYDYQIQAQADNGAVSALSTAVRVTNPTSTVSVPTVAIAKNGITDMDDYFASLTRTIQQWYPKIVDKVTGGAYAAPNTVVIVMTLGTNCGAASAGLENGEVVVHLCEQFARDQPGDMTVFEHEVTHGIQGYTAEISHMVVEGIASWAADWASDYQQSPPSDTMMYDDGYGTASYFFDWISATYNKPNLVRDMNVAAHNNGTDGTVIIEQQTGKTVQQLWYDMTGRRVTAAGHVVGVASKCIYTAGNSSNGATLYLYPCYETWFEKFVYMQNPSDTTTGIVKYGQGSDCIVVSGGGTANGTAAVLGNCSFGDSAALWRRTADNGLQNVLSGRCLRPKGGNQADSTPLEITDCNNTAQSPSQKWTFPSY